MGWAWPVSAALNPLRLRLSDTDLCSPRRSGCRYCWLPVKPSKIDRQGLARVLPAALRFVWHHLRSGRRILIHCDEGELCRAAPNCFQQNTEADQTFTGYDTCVAVAVAVLLCCFTADGKLRQQGLSACDQPPPLDFCVTRGTCPP